MTIAIIGAGLAGASAAAELREQGYDGDIVLVGAEPHAPYERPPLSKDILLRTGTAADAAVKDDGWYEEHRVELVTGSAATDLDLSARSFAVGDRKVDYDDLLIATGATSRHLPMVAESGAPLRGSAVAPQDIAFAYLRTIEESEALRRNLTGHLLIIGAGWIGLEVASAARQAGGAVTVVEAAPRPLAGPLGEEMASVLSGLHREHGVDLRTSTTVETIEREKGRTRAVLSDGTEVSPGLVLVAIGAVPDVALAEGAGLAVDDGILVDARLRTSDPHVYAAGDVANHDHPSLGRIRVEHWDNAIQQGRHAARSMLGGQEPYARQPYFFTDQYDLGMEYVGHLGPDGCDEVVVRGDRDSRVLNALMIRGGRVVAGMHTNDWDATDHLRACVGREATKDMCDASIPLADAHG